MRVTLDPQDWKSWKDWERVLVLWKEYGRDGLTLQALSYICRRPYPDILAEIKDRRTAGGWYCATIEAPIFLMRYQEYPYGSGEIKWDSGCGIFTDHSGPMGFTDTSETKFMNHVLDLIEKYPPPKYKGLKDEKGIRSRAGITLTRFVQLRKAAKGSRSPWIRKGVHQL